jgi:hypothetical protein
LEETREKNLDERLEKGMEYERNVLKETEEELKTKLNKDLVLP